MTDERREEVKDKDKIVEPVEKIRVKVRDGVAFQFASTVRDGLGFIQNFIPGPPALSGEVIEIEPNQALGQEQKLMRLEPVILACANSTCKNIYETDAFDIRVSRCPRCGAQGGSVIETKKKKKKGKDKTKTKLKVKETNRMDNKEEETRKDELEIIVPDVSVKVAKKKKAAKKGKK